MFPTPPKKAILQSGILSSGFSCLLQLATGSGKTWLAEQTLEATARSGKRGIYVSPTRALASELFVRWSKELDVTVGVFTGDYGATADSKYPVPFKSADILIMTPERLDACTRHWRNHWEWIPEVDLIVVDEFHLLGEGGRGARLEGALLRMMRLNPFIRIQGLSATLGNLNELTQWLRGVCYQSDWRPVPMSWSILRFKAATEKPGLLIEELKAGGDIKTLVFVQSRRRAEQLDQLLRAQGIRSAHHHAGLTLQQRGEVERIFRSGEIDVLLATPTLEVGVNLPVRKVVLYDLQYFDGREYTPLKVNQVWQRVGRAGRPGFDDQGEAVLIAPRWDREVKHYPQGEFEPIRSQLSQVNFLAEQVIAEVASGLCRTRSELAHCLQGSLAAHQKRLPKLNPVIDEMVEAGMLLELENEKNTNAGMKLKATRLGRIAAQQMLSPSTVLLFHRHINTSGELYFFDLLLLVCSAPDCEPCLPVDYEELEALAVAVQDEPSALVERHFQGLGIFGKRLLSALKMTVLIRQWTRGEELDNLAEAFGCYGFEVRRLCDSVLRLLPALSGVVEQDEEDPLSKKTAQALKEKITALQGMVAGGLDENKASLMLVSGIGWKWARRLVEAEVGDVEDLAQLDADFFTALKGVSPERAQRWIKDAEKLMHTHTFQFFRESNKTEHKIYTKKKSGIDPYRLRRAMELGVKMIEAGYYRVTGGQDPHTVKFSTSQQSCDCPDYAKGNTCKHLLAVRHYRQDQAIIAQIKALQVCDGDMDLGIDLLHLWSERESRKAA